MRTRRSEDTRLIARRDPLDRGFRAGMHGAIHWIAASGVREVINALAGVILGREEDDAGFFCWGYGRFH